MGLIAEGMHIRLLTVRLPGEPPTYGFLTLCGLRVKHATKEHSGELTCRKCLRVYIANREAEIERLKRIMGPK